MEGNPPDGGHEPPVDQTSKSLVPATQISSINTKLPTVRQLHFQWSNSKFRSLMLNTPERTPTIPDAQAEFKMNK
jgi:hypothetical protein